jgi:lipoprotein-anchoring transpeptidase ErfK/SrfK
MPFRDAVALQTLLDRQNFSCNCADGVIGQKTRQALRAWQAMNDLPVTGKPDEFTLGRLGPLDAAFTTHTVSAEEIAALTPVPKTWWGKSQAPRLGYETVLETVAEEYHASGEAIRKLNPDAPWPNPPAGTSLVVPNPRPFKTPPAATLTIFIGEKLIRATDGDGRLIAQFPCSIAKDKEKLPAGDLTIVNCASDPTYTLDPAVFLEDKEVQALGKRLLIPAGPNNPVGIAWITLSQSGYGIHGTPRPEDIGKTGSHGCFRLANWNAGKLLRMIRIGMPVRVEE